MAASTPGRVVVTGLGTVNPLAASTPDFGTALQRGASALGPLTLFDTAGFRSRIGGEVRNADRLTLPSAVGAPLRRRLSRADLFALVATAEALTDGRLDPAEGRVGIALGGTTGGMLRTEASIRARVETGRRYRIGQLAGAPVSTSADVVAGVFGTTGPRLTVSTACSSSAMALGLALDWLRLGRCDAVVAGGTETLCATVFAGFNALHAVAAEPCRPFDRQRNGLSLGEGAAVMLLETEERAHARGAPIHAVLLGYGASADAHHLTAPHPEARGATLAMRRALDRAGLAPDAIDYVNAHGTGTPLNDTSEIRALHEVFTGAARPAVSSTKSAIGHTLGAAGAIEALATVLAVRDGFLPPTLALEDPEDATFDFVPRAARPASIRYALSNSYGFGGNNTSLVLGRAD